MAGKVPAASSPLRAGRYTSVASERPSRIGTITGTTAASNASSGVCTGGTGTCAVPSLPAASHTSAVIAMDAAPSGRTRRGDEQKEEARRRPPSADCSLILVISAVAFPFQLTDRLDEF